MASGDLNFKVHTFKFLMVLLFWSSILFYFNLYSSLAVANIFFAHHIFHSISILKSGKNLSFVDTAFSLVFGKKCPWGYYPRKIALQKIGFKDFSSFFDMILQLSLFFIFKIFISQVSKPYLGPPKHL